MYVIVGPTGFIPYYVQNLEGSHLRYSRLLLLAKKFATADAARKHLQHGEQIEWKEGLR